MGMFLFFSDEQRPFDKQIFTLEKLKNKYAVEYCLLLVLIKSADVI